MVQLTLLSREELVEDWSKTHGTSPPKGVRRGLLERSAAYDLQAKRFGKLKPAIRKALLAFARSEDETDQVFTRPTPEVGARLIREWNGKTHQVLVTKDGFEWDGEPHRSLSSIARSITGAHWSGPRFFGL